MDSALLALIGLLAVMALLGVLVVGLVAYRQQEQIRHLGAAMRTLTREWKGATGQGIQLDPGLLGEPADVVAPDDDRWSKVPAAVAPWKVRETPTE